MSRSPGAEAWSMRGWWASSAVALVLLGGCAALSTDATFDTPLQWPAGTSSPMADSPTTQPAAPAAEADPDVQQLAGQLVAGVQAELTSRVEAAVEAAVQSEIRATGIGGNATGYNSEFGIGATLVVSLTLILALILSHRREMTRLRQNGRHVILDRVET